MHDWLRVSECFQEDGAAASRPGLHTASSLRKCTLRAIIKATPTAVASPSPFAARIDTCPGDWMLEALVQHLWEQGLQRQSAGRGCGAFLGETGGAQLRACLCRV